jgi:asparagine synthase (glutamine-hydrolysing)
MPGIVGCITRFPRAHAEEEVLQIVGALHHENFYVGGTWADESLGVYLGWVAREGSFCDRMPLQNERGDVVLAFSGEEFPEPGVTQRLKERGHEFDLAGPAYLVHLSEEDPAFPTALNGRFHGVLTDRNRNVTILFNDRYGMHRIYYHQSKTAFYFAAEAKAILIVRPELRKIDPRGLGEFVACGCTLENRSLFEDIHVLPGASRWVFRNGSLLRKERYFEPREWENQGRLAAGALLPGSPRRLFKEPAPVLQGSRPGRHVPDRRPGYPNDPWLGNGVSQDLYRVTASEECFATIRTLSLHGR